MEKVEKITIRSRGVGEIMFSSDDFCVGVIKNQIIKSIDKLENIYKIKTPKFKIQLIYSRKEFNRKLGKTETPNWLVANTKNGGNNIFIFSPQVIEKYSSHKKIDFQKIISHELCHIFNNRINENAPILIDEGIALYLSQQKKSKDFKKNDWNFFINNIHKDISFDSFVKHNGYRVSYWMISGAVNSSNYNNLTSLLKNPSSLLMKEGSLC